MRIENRMVGKMRAGQIAIGLGATLPPSTQVPVFAGRAGFDWAFIDLEHTLISPEHVGLLATTFSMQGITPLARIPKPALFDIARLLDSGVEGIILPHVETAQQAGRLVEMCKYAPTGQRSWGGASPQLGFPQKPSPQLMAEANAATLAIVMIESAVSMENIEAIAKVPGLDGVLIGCVDLSCDLGVMGRPDAPEMVATINTIGRAANAAGKYFGLAGASTPAVLTGHSEIRVDFALAGMDYRILVTALDERAGLWRRTVSEGRA